MIFTHMLIVLTMVSSGDSGRRCCRQIRMLIANVHITDICLCFSLSMSKKPGERESDLCEIEPEKDVKIKRKRKKD